LSAVKQENDVAEWIVQIGQPGGAPPARIVAVTADDTASAAEAAAKYIRDETRVRHSIGQGEGSLDAGRLDHPGAMDHLSSVGETQQR
jgi:hypothetical protein